MLAASVADRLPDAAKVLVEVSEQADGDELLGGHWR
jgi:hypothetical protein